MLTKVGAVLTWLITCGDPGAPCPVGMCAACGNRSLYSSEETLPDIGAKATMAPTPIQRRACPGLAYPYDGLTKGSARLGNAAKNKES